MKILNLNREFAEIQFPIEYLKVFKNSLVEVCQQLTPNDFASIIWDISREEAIELTRIITELIDNSSNNSYSLPNNPFIESFTFVKNRVILRMPYRSINGLRSIIHKTYYQAFLKITDSQKQIGIKKEDLNYLLTFLLYDVIEKMEEGSPSNIIFNRTRELVQELNLERESLAKNPLGQANKKKCKLELQEYQLLLLLMGSNKDSKIFSKIQTLASKISNPNLFWIKSDVYFIRHDSLVNLISYLELALESAFDTTDLKTFTLELFPSLGKPFFEIQVLSELIKAEEQSFLKLRLRIYLAIQEEDKDRKYLEIEETATASNIQSFTSEIRAFLSELPRNKVNNVE